MGQDKWSQYQTPTQDKWSQYESTPASGNQVVPQSVLDNLRAKTQTPQGGAGYSNFHPLDVAANAASGFASDAWNTIKGGFHAFTDPAQTPDEVALGGSTTRFGQLTNPSSQVPLVLKRLGQAQYQSSVESQQSAREAADKGQAMKSFIESAAAGLPLVGPLVHGVYQANEEGPAGRGVGVGASRALQALSMAPEGSNLPNPILKGADALNSIKTRMQGPVIADPNPAMNLAGAAKEGGLPGNGLRIREDIAEPALNDFQNAAADTGLTPEVARGPNAHNAFVDTTRRMVTNVEAEARPVLDAVRTQATNGIQNQIAADIMKQRPVTADPMTTDAYTRLADRARSANTIGDLLDLKSDLNKLSGSKSFSNISSEGFSAMDAAADAGDAIRKNLYPRISQLTGTDIGPIMQREMNAIRLQTLAEKAAPKLSAQQSASRTLGYISRLRQGEGLLDTTKNALGVGKPAGYELFQDRLVRSLKGAQPSTPPIQGPVNVQGGRVANNPPQGPNPGSPLPGGGTVAGPDTAPSFTRFNPYSNPTGRQNPNQPPSSEGGGPMRTSEAESSLTGRSNEALARLRNDLRAGRKYFRVNTRTGQHTPVTTLSPEDITLNPGEELRYFPKPEWPDYSELVNRR